VLPLDDLVHYFVGFLCPSCPSGVHVGNESPFPFFHFRTQMEEYITGADLGTKLGEYIVLRLLLDNDLLWLIYTEE